MIDDTEWRFSHRVNQYHKAEFSNPCGNHLDRNLPLVPNINLINPMYTLPSHFSQIDFHIIVCSVLGFYKWTLSFRFSHQFQYAPLLSPVCSTCPAPLILLELITRIIFCEVLKIWSWALWNFVWPPGTACLLCQCVFLSTLFLTTVGLCSPLNVRYWEFYTNMCSNKLIAEVFTFLGCRME